jgi:hypothetical protein
MKKQTIRSAKRMSLTFIAAITNIIGAAFPTSAQD